MPHLVNAHFMTKLSKYNLHRQIVDGNKQKRVVEKNVKGHKDKI